MPISTRDLLSDFDVRINRIPGGVGSVREIVSADAARFAIHFLTTTTGNWRILPAAFALTGPAYAVNSTQSQRFNFRDDGPIVCYAWQGHWTGIANDITVIEIVYKPQR